MKVYLLVWQGNDTDAHVTPGEWGSDIGEGSGMDDFHDAHDRVVPCAYVIPQCDPKCEGARVQVRETWVSSARRAHSYGV